MQDDDLLVCCEIGIQWRKPEEDIVDLRTQGENKAGRKLFHVAPQGSPPPFS